ncbi:hypothetical protein [Fructobacillus cardui]|uniref:hypothetical protein n=1 Tax=Fructobacillus cardui TaxID=2893170 RepID=UPI00200A48F2|nr:hypothetical protein [Fructobacillus cardui]MCK8626995.1 hypothetical protein [Fructobacillus cardui]
MVEKVRLADEEDFTKVGLQKNHIVPREDAGGRTPKAKITNGGTLMPTSMMVPS